MVKPFIVLCLALSVTACGSLPDVEVGYYLPKSSVVITVTQSAACLKQNDGSWKTSLKSSTTYLTKYSADTRQPYTVDLAKLDAWYGKPDVDFSFTEDGRLKSINSTGMGHGEALVTGVAKALSLGGVGIKTLAPGEHGCKKLVAHNRAHDGKTDGGPKVLSVVLQATSDLNPDTPIVFKPIDLSLETYQELQQDIYGWVEAGIGETTPPLAPRNTFSTEDYNGEKIAYRIPAAVPVITVIKDFNGNETHSSETNISAPQYGVTHYLPIQKAPLFGENSMKLTLDDNGNIIGLKYGSDSGAGSLVSALNTSYETLKSEPKATTTVAQQAESVKAQADLIYQNERLAQCELKPSLCLAP